MKIPKSLFPSLLVVTVIFLPSLCFSQNSIKEFKDSSGLHSYLVFRGDTLFIGYDSAYIMNKRTFKLFNENYIRVQKGDPSVKKLFREYENVIAHQDSMLIAKEKDYQELKLNFTALAENSTNFIKRTDLNIQAIDTSLSNATTHLNNIDSILSGSLNKLKLQNKQKIKLAAGGFTIGIVVASIIFLIAK